MLLFPATYAYGHDAMGFEGRCLAACLAIGGDAMITGAAAGWLRRVERRRPDVIEVTTTRNARADLPGVRVIRSRSIRPQDRGGDTALPIASVARMLVDRAGTATATELADVMHECEYRGVLRAREVERCARRFASRRGPGPRRMAQALELQASGSSGTQSGFERRVLGELLEAGAPMPRITPVVELADGRSIRPDLVFDDERVVVEVDGRRSHERRRTQVRDARKAAELAELGYVTARVRERHVATDVLAVLELLRERG